MASVALLACGAASSDERAPDPTEGSAEAAEGVDGTAGEYQELASFRANTCGLRRDGRIRCWSTFGTTVEVAEGVFEHLGGGAANVCGITSEGALLCPAEPAMDPMAQSGPIGIPQGGPFRAVSGGRTFRCALERSGAIRCHGGNPLLTPDPPEGSFVALVAGGTSVCGLTEAGRVECSTADGPPVQLRGGPYASIAGSESVVCGIRRSDGGVDCSRPFPGDEPPGVGFTQIAVGSAHGCGLREGGAHCWGLMIDPAFFPSPGEPAERVTVGQHTCLLRRDGTVGCWDTHQVTLQMP